MQRIACFIDGFNLYHALTTDDKYKKYKWLNLRKLCESFLRKDQKISNIFYFSAYATWMPEKMKKHQKYVRALELYGVEPILGKFKDKDRFCPLCKKKYKSHEEKKTDVNIAIKLLQEAVADTYDVAIIVSGDSDLIPSILAVKSTFPAKKIGILIPIGRAAEELKNAADFHIKLKEKHLISSQLPQRIEKDGAVLEKPDSW